jgi:hypothetical protein
MTIAQLVLEHIKMLELLADMKPAKRAQALKLPR